MWLIFLLFCFTAGVHYPNDSCYKYDCSDQLQHAPEGSCAIYNTSVCLDSFLQLNESSIKDLKDEADSAFTVSVIPYQTEIKLHHLPKLISPINITFHIQKGGVNHVAVKITKRISRPLCRVFDFRNYSTNSSLPMTLFHDCLYFEPNIRNLFMEFISLSTNEKLSYYVYIPVTEQIESVCDWQPAIMVFSGSLPNRKVLVKFSQAPLWLNVSTYTIKITPASSTKKEIFSLPADQKRDLLYLEYISTDDDNYTVTVIPVTNRKNDCETTTATFYVGIPKFAVDMRIIKYICIALFLFGSAVLLTFLYSKISSDNKQSKQGVNLLLVHFCGSSVFEDFIQAFSNFLTSQHNCVVSTIYGCSPDPLEFLTEKLKLHECIIFIISEHLFFTLDSTHFRPLEANHQFLFQPTAVGNIMHQQLFSPNSYFKNKRIAAVCFPFTNENHIPEWLKVATGKSYMLPEEMSAFLGFIFDYRHILSCFRLRSLFFNSNIENYNEGKTLCEKIRAVQAEHDAHVIAFPTQIEENNIETEQSKKATSDNDSESSSLLESSIYSGSSSVNSLLNSIKNLAFKCNSSHIDKGQISQSSAESDSPTDSISSEDLEDDISSSSGQSVNSSLVAG